MILHRSNISRCAAVVLRAGSDIGGHAGIGNINVNPKFVDYLNGNLHLRPSSPCIDAGRNSYLPQSITTDIDGNPRFIDRPQTPDTAFGTPPIVDMGAYEFQP